MANRVRCKVCGFIMEEGKFDECPACGVAAKMFEAFDDKVPDNRRSWLEMHVHPVIVHAPQALGFLLILLAGLYFILAHTVPDSGLAAMLLPTVKILSVLLPLTVAAGIVSGLVDGTFRFKRLDTIYLKRKIALGSIFLVLAVVMAFLAFRPAFPTGIGIELGYLALNVGAFLCSMFLGLWGAALTQAVMPGPFPAKKKN